MENSSKALLIAAAVIVCILLITFGIKIFNSNSNTSKEADTIGKTMSETIASETTAVFPEIERSTASIESYGIDNIQESSQIDLNPTGIIPQGGTYYKGVEDKKTISKTCAKGNYEENDGVTIIRAGENFPEVVEKRGYIYIWRL